MRNLRRKFGIFGIVLAAFFAVAGFAHFDETKAISVSGNVKVQAEITPSVSMQIQSPNDNDPTCVAESGAKPSCASLAMEPDTYNSSYSDITVYTNNYSGYSLTVEAADPNLTNVSDSTLTIPTGILAERGGSVPGGQNKWSFKSDGYIEKWTAMSSSPITVVAYNSPVPEG